jgi:hypothetical protein
MLLLVVGWLALALGVVGLARFPNSGMVLIATGATFVAAAGTKRR